MRPDDSADAQPVRFPRLVASDARMEPAPVVGFAVPLTPPQTSDTSLAGRAGEAEPVASSTGPADEMAYQRIAALSAVPVGPAPSGSRGSEAMTGTDFLLTWADQGANLLRQGWREMLLFLAMALAAGMLFWRLGERSRHAEQELVLDVVAEPEHDAFVEAVGIAAIAMPSKESEPQETVQEQEEQEMAQETRLPEPKSDRRFATLHAALQEMKADMARNGGAVRRPAVPA